MADAPPTVDQVGAAAAAAAADDDAAPPEWWDALKASEAAVRTTHALAALAARGPEDFGPSRPAPPPLPPGAWAVIMDTADSCRCAGGWKGGARACAHCPFSLPTYIAPRRRALARVHVSRSLACLPFFPSSHPKAARVLLA